VNDDTWKERRQKQRPDLGPRPGVVCSPGGGAPSTGAPERTHDQRHRGARIPGGGGQRYDRTAHCIDRGWLQLACACGGELRAFGVGSIAEVFDAEPPFTPRACVAQARSEAEVLRCWVKTS
jgi:hypothetical protein